MSDAARLSRVAALVGDPARANMLAALLNGRAMTASELAYAARVTPQTASEHLGKLVDAGLFAPPARQGRHRYYRLASAQVAAMLESIMVAAGAPPTAPRLSTWRGGEALRNARTCYDHLAGRLGVGITDALCRLDHLILDENGGELTAAGTACLRDLGVDLPPTAGRSYCRPCMDWSERRFHLAGRLGSAIASRCFELGWVERQPTGRALLITDEGARAFSAHFGLSISPVSEPVAAPRRAA